MAVIIGTKVGMTSVYDNHNLVPVTVISADTNTITAIKDEGSYKAIQVAYGSRKAKNLSKALRGHLAKANLESAKCIREFRLDEDTDMASYSVGQSVDLAGFEAFSKVNATRVNAPKVKVLQGL